MHIALKKNNNSDVKLLQPSKLTVLTHTCRGTIELAAAISHAGSHGEFPHVRQHDKRRI